MTASLLMLPLSGYMNHYYQFDPLSTARHFWMAFHDVAAILFAVFSVIHIVFNRRLLLNYIKKAKSIIVTKEAVLAALLIVFIVGFISMHAFHVR